MKVKTICFFLLIPVLTIALSCKSTPKEGVAAAISEPAPGQEDLHTLGIMTSRATEARESALNVRGQIYCPDEWNAAEKEYSTGVNAKKDTLVSVLAAVVSLTAAAESYDAITATSAPLYAEDVAKARTDMEAAKAQAEKSRNNASLKRAPVYFPDDWEPAEASYQGGMEAHPGIVTAFEEVPEGGYLPIAAFAKMNATTELFVSAAERYDSLTEKSEPLYAQEKDEAMKGMQEVLAKMEQSKKDAQAASANTYFANDWKAAETEYQAAKKAKTDSLEDIAAASALFAASADTYNSLAEKSRPLAAKDAAQKDLTAAMARAEKSRQAAVAVDGATYYPNEWKNAETSNTNAKNAKKTTAEEVAAAAALYVSAADAYDAITKNSSPRFTKDTADATKALQTAITRSEKSRQDATTAKAETNFPAEWKSAETKNSNAKSAKRATPAEIKAATTLYSQAADAYDDIARKSTARVAEETQKTSQTARDRADKERKAAVDAKADVAVASEFSRADALYQQAVKDFNAKTYGPAAERFNQSADQFAAVAASISSRRNRAAEIIENAKRKSDESAAFAVTTGQILEEGNEM